MEQKNLLPKKLGLVAQGSRKGFPGKVNAAGLLGTVGYQEMFSAGITSESFRNTSAIDLRDNKINSQRLPNVLLGHSLTVVQILSSLPPKIEELNLSSNCLDKHACAIISKLVSERGLK